MLGTSVLFVKKLDTGDYTAGSLRLQLHLHIVCILISLRVQVIGWIDPNGLEGFVYILIEFRIKYILKILVLFSNSITIRLSLQGH